MLHIYHLCGIFYFPWHRHQIEGTNGLWCLIRKTQVNLKWVSRTTHVLKLRQWDSNTQPHDLTTEIPCPTTSLSTNLTPAVSGKLLDIQHVLRVASEAFLHRNLHLPNLLRYLTPHKRQASQRSEECIPYATAQTYNVVIMGDRN